MSPWVVVALIWLALQLASILTRKLAGPPGPPGGRVIAIHNDAEWTDAQREAKESGKLVRGHTVLSRVRAFSGWRTLTAASAAVGGGLLSHVVPAMPHDWAHLRYAV